MLVLAQLCDQHQALHPGQNYSLKEEQENPLNFRLNDNKFILVQIWLFVTCKQNWHIFKAYVYRSNIANVVCGISTYVYVERQHELTIT
jgi:hypothetical protein